MYSLNSLQLLNFSGSSEQALFYLYRFLQNWSKLFFFAVYSRFCNFLNLSLSFGYPPRGSYFSQRKLPCCGIIIDIYIMSLESSKSTLPDCSLSDFLDLLKISDKADFDPSLWLLFGASKLSQSTLKFSTFYSISQMFCFFSGSPKSNSNSPILLINNVYKGILAAIANYLMKYFIQQLSFSLKMKSRLVELITIFAILFISSCGPILNNYPIVFQIYGTTTYVPDVGGASRAGYKIKMGFSYYQWMAIEIVTGTDKNDVLVLQIDEFYTQGVTPLRTGHQVKVTDYYRSGDTLVFDQNNQYDISSFSYSQDKAYQIDMIRYLGSNSGQDWNAGANGYSLMQTCFYTSQNLFSTDTWTNGLKQCYFFEINNHFSTFKGVKLKSFSLNGYQTGIYGWIDGPYVTDNVYFYQQVPLFTYTKEPAVAIELGTTLGQVGQDFNVYSPVASERGDYYGSAITSMSKDIVNHGGYENSGLTLQHWNAVPATQIPGLSFTSLRITFSRNISTFDNYDRKLQSTFIFCLYLFNVGSINGELTDKSCEAVQLSYHYPRMTLPVITQHIETLRVWWILLFFLFLVWI